MSSTTPYDVLYTPDLTKLPDPQTFHSVEGADVAIQKVGINNFEFPILTRDSTRYGVPLDNQPASISLYVDLPKGVKGINMSRLVRVTAEEDNGEFKGLDVSSNTEMKRYLGLMLDRAEANTVYFKAKYKAAVQQPSLRSGLVGYQYYNVERELSLTREGKFAQYTTVDFIYSSACPCSYELAKQAIRERFVDAISHSQRSLCRVTVKHDDELYDDEIVMMLREALVTEVQVMVKREDEQAFAELNGSYPKFVEDAARLVFDRLSREARIIDFVSVHEHWESLHGHNAVSVIRKLDNGGLK